MNNDYDEDFKLGSDKVWTITDKDPWKDARTVEMTEPGLKIVRVALLAHDFPYKHIHDCSYILGIINDTEYVRVHSPFDYWNGMTWKTDLYKWGKENNVYIKGLGIYDNEVIRWDV